MRIAEPAVSSRQFDPFRPRRHDSFVHTLSANGVVCLSHQPLLLAYERLVTSMNSADNKTTLPADVEIVPAATVRRMIPETTLWRLDKSGDLPAVRIGRRRYYRLSDLRAFLNRAQENPPIAVPWAKEHAR